MTIDADGHIMLPPVIWDKCFNFRRPGLADGAGMRQAPPDQAIFGLEL